MLELENFAEGGLGTQEKKLLSGALHDMCQPLTTLQCRLEMATLTDSVEAYREAAQMGMAECRRMAESVCRMREILLEVAGQDEAMRQCADDAGVCGLRDY
jgi:hypothetical protein